ncbi:MAG: DUF2085 domain-containing protein [Ignavibacteriales bacterium]|nr:DUF2085 domain-containing protein [Ignavibacteriales bacterium]
MRFQYRLALFLVLLIWFAGIFVEWLITLDNHFLFALPFLQKTYSLVCHQEKAKLMIFNHAETLTCARCTGIYLGLLLVSMIFLFKDYKRNFPIKFLLYASIPMIADVILYSINIYHYSKPVAFVSGLLLGSVGFLYLYKGLNNLIIELKN